MFTMLQKTVEKNKQKNIYIYIYTHINKKKLNK